MNSSDPPPEPISDARMLGEVPRSERPQGAPRRATARLMLASPLHLIALGFGSGLSPLAPGTAGTLWAWISFLLLQRWLSEAQWAVLLLASFGLGWWACTATARALRVPDPSAIVWDEILAFWLILWLISPASWALQTATFLIFRLFDAAKPGPMGWADRLFKSQPGQPPGWAQGFGILFDDLVAALCTLVVLALWRV